MSYQIIGGYLGQSASEGGTSQGLAKKVLRISTSGCRNFYCGIICISSPDLRDYLAAEALRVLGLDMLALSVFTSDIYGRKLYFCVFITPAGTLANPQRHNS